MLKLTDHFEPDHERAAGEVIDGEAIIIDLATGVYYSMRGIGGEIWNLISERRSGDEILTHIVARYDVDPLIARADLEKIVGQLVGDGLIRAVANGDAVPFAVAESRDRLPYASPELQAYRDMEDLLALDPPAPGMKQIAWKGDASN